MVIVRDFDRPSKEVISELSEYSTADIHEALGKTNAMAPDIGPISGEETVCGPACTVQVPPGDNMMVHAGVDYAQKGDILVVATASDRAAVWGELSTLNAQKQGLAGFVSDGNVRDSAWLANNEFPVFAPTISQAGAVKETPGSVNVPVAVGGVVVSPGDILSGDSDGITVVPRENASEILEATKAKADQEDYLRRQIHEGESLYELLNLDKKIAEHDVQIVDSVNEG
ncbi:regulator of ribonuclease activity A [Halalkalicoccus paucihalophilus]|uniref:Regulator of ribonuclease activity A n=1 Tax=Halalkalicoccus paucihalophilus TaxID=1008153 RepID=A0A151A8R6_9EURY|nr:4-carboxy-4-hydroxy-2-oxoadipate aldolase/oxaloacetate decarboxylase [Halalkalicoccus paucihalophilus]KYH24003.1 regulator of ribonuclease activity A [Halalkalicoccus paucihalophilus]